MDKRVTQTEVCFMRGTYDGLKKNAHAFITHSHFIAPDFTFQCLLTLTLKTLREQWLSNGSEKRIWYMLHFKSLSFVNPYAFIEAFNLWSCRLIDAEPSRTKEPQGPNDVITEAHMELDQVSLWHYLPVEIQDLIVTIARKRVRLQSTGTE